MKYAMHYTQQAAAYHEAGHVVAQVVTYRSVLFPRPKPSPLIYYVEIVEEAPKEPVNHLSLWVVTTETRVLNLPRR